MLGCVKRAPAARGDQDAGITQPRDHTLADPCNCTAFQFSSEFERLNLRDMRLIVTLYAAWCVAADGIDAINIIPGKACGLQTEVKTADRSLSASDIMRTYSGMSKDSKVTKIINIFVRAKYCFFLQI